MKAQFAIHMPPTQAQQPMSIWRRWKRLTTCQKRSLIVVVFLLVTSFSVGSRLHELHQKSLSHHKHKKKHKNHHETIETEDKDSEIDSELVPLDPELENDDDDFDEDYEAKAEEEIDEPSEEVEEAVENVELEPELESKQNWRGAARENDQQRQIREAFQHAWKGYKRYAWGHDMLKPISKGYEDWFTTKSDLMGLTVSFCKKL